MVPTPGTRRKAPLLELSDFKTGLLLAGYRENREKASEENPKALFRPKH
jgi:hypothetical protein